MKKQTAIGLIVVILLIATIGLHSCKSPEPKATTTVTLKVATPDFLHKLSDYSTDELYLKAVTAATEKQNTDTTHSFIELFHDAWNELTLNGRLTSIFATFELREYIRPDFTNEEVVRVLLKEWDHAFSNTINTLLLRIDRYGSGSVGIHRVGNSDLVQLKMLGVENPERLINLLTQTGELEIWETYGNTSTGSDSGVFDMLSLANNLIRELNEAKEKTEDESQHPLFSILMPSVDTQTGQPIQTAFIGIAPNSDTAKINEMLTMPEVRNIFPDNLRFLWSTDKKDNELELFAIKVNMRDNKVPLDGTLIVSAKTEKQEQGLGVRVAMNREGSIIFSRLTADNIGKFLAFVLDGRVLMCPMVQSEITGGQCSIMGQLTDEEAEDLATLLNSGKLPLHVQLIAKTTEENVAQQ